MTTARRTIVATGTVRFLNPDNGNGLIRPDDGSDDIYVCLEPGQVGSIAKARRVQYKLHMPEIGAPWLGDLQAL